MKSVFDVKSITNNYNYSADVPWIHTQTKIGIYEKVEKKIEGKYKPVPEKPRSFEEVKRVVKRLNTYVQQDYKVDVPTVVKYVQGRLFPDLVSLQDNKNCEVLKQAIFTAKKKNLKGKYTDKSHKEIFSKLGRLYKYMTNKKFECKPEQFEVFKDSIFPYLCLDAVVKNILHTPGPSHIYWNVCIFCAFVVKFIFQSCQANQKPSENRAHQHWNEIVCAMLKDAYVFDSRYNLMWLFIRYMPMPGTFPL